MSPEMEARETSEELARPTSEYLAQVAMLLSLSKGARLGPGERADLAQAAARLRSLSSDLQSRDAEIARLKGLLEPFANEAEMWGDAVPDDHAPLCVEMGHTDGEYYGSAAKYTVGDLRKTRAALGGEG